MNICQCKNMLGEPGIGVHSYRFAGLAIVDVIATILGAGLLAWITGARYWITLVALFVLGILLHRLFCVRTTIDKMIFK